MDPTRKLRERQASQQASGPRLSPYRYGLGVLGGIGILFGIVCSIAGDVQLVYDAWPFRNAVRTNGQVFEYQFDQIQNGPNMGFVRLGGDHRFRYRFSVDGQEVTGEYESFSIDPNSVLVMEQFFPVGPDASIPIYYSPDDPHTHMLFVNPVPLFKESATRLAWVSLIIAIGVLVVVLVVVFYRPKKTERYLPAKLGLPDAEIKIEDLQIKT